MAPSMAGTRAVPIFTACIDRDRGEYVAWVHSARGLIMTKSFHSADEAVGFLVEQNRELFHCEVHRDVFTEPPHPTAGEKHGR